MYRFRRYVNATKIQSAYKKAVVRMRNDNTDDSSDQLGFKKNKFI